ncbi:MAG: hypothetical protein M1835_001170 [Candelina submexicana]|nr:MAG: hypothetical protein M1835_001170 [Candelina submexicana]
MDIPQLTSAPSIRVSDFNSKNHDRYRSSSRSSPYSPSLPTKAPSPMSIPNSRGHDAPPPLPPPRNVLDLSNGSDLGWQMGNSFGRSSFGSVNPGSSLYGSFARKDGGETEKEQNNTSSWRSNSISTFKSLPSMDFDAGHSEARFTDEGYVSLSNSNILSHKLQGEKSLGHKNLRNSEQAYDKHLLSKFGSTRSEASTRNSSISSSRNFQSSAIGSPNQDLSPKIPMELQGKHSSLLRPLSVPDDASKVEQPQHKWSSGAQSATVSPGQISSPSSSQSCVDFRSPKYHRNSASSIMTDQERSLQGREVKSTPGSSSIFSNYDDNASFASRSNRGSYDQGYNETDSDFPMEEAGLKQLNLGDRTPPHLEEGLSPVSTLGQKRRASSPPREATREERLSLCTSGGSSEPFQRRASGHLSASRSSPVHRFHSSHGSISSISSLGGRTASYTSSTPLSVTSSSITSMSSLDRHSPGVVSPSSEMDLSQDSPYVHPASLDPSPRGSVSRMNPQRTFPESKPTSAGRKMSSDEISHIKHHSAPRLKGVYMCDCCPKKPKKFDTQEELQVHAMEKQYTCQYCTNRFKNKNEAERHQNSLHLRRHSWSCAALSHYEGAFHASTSHPNAADVCGYCGDEFAKPANWDVRREHLSNIHKFGECNQAKKFFRADHFRQHLKHSHAGTSGKWTNILENACMKDEPLPERMGSIGGGDIRNGADVMGSVIDEVHDES